MNRITNLLIAMVVAAGAQPLSAANGPCRVVRCSPPQVLAFVVLRDAAPPAEVVSTRGAARVVVAALGRHLSSEPGLIGAGVFVRADNVLGVLGSGRPTVVAFSGSSPALVRGPPFIL